MHPEGVGGNDPGVNRRRRVMDGNQSDEFGSLSFFGLHLDCG